MASALPLSRAGSWPFRSQRQRQTTLIKLANGLLTPSSGEILIDGRTPGRETHAMVSYLPERTAIPTWMSAGQLMDFTRISTRTSAVRPRRRCFTI